MDLTVRINLTSHRTFRSEPDGCYDREIDIWYNANWMPACFSDLQKGDFFLDMKLGTWAGKCFLAMSDVKRIEQRRYSNDPSFVIQGLEVVQAPAIKDIEPIELPQPIKPLELK